ncbi:NAD(P)-dependent oxidoreductase [Gallaecimonas xiamenensis]|uniref:3-hydroxyisobutyrate dehydrogenase n=1 Tax=Gallaecimonas xiamenensis 3-C-1 TaxID=745411 RepID=K2J785_9GAMM|nr:NAD(P)-dependent oxidoreductase [Gallaecimonas xiamenensis]EKE70958.1 3-hydroxyisobutyrate dehydrogenase [Gallaecimonas xiamenensis 3-C-1]
MKVAFLGLGVMGYPMAGHLQAAGFEVCVYNRTTSKAEQWVAQHGGTLGATPAEAAKGAILVMMCVGNDDDVRAVAYEAITTMAPGAILVDHTTASAEVARELHQALKAKQLGFLDAPVSGGQAGAENGQLTIMVGGDAGIYAKAEGVLKTYAKQIKRLGEAGSGQLCKMVNQICIAGVVQGLAEAVNFAQQAGLNVVDVVEVISKGAAQSWQMENRALTMDKGQYDFGFAVDWMRKDLAIALAEARKNGSPLPLTALVDQFYADVQRLGGSRWDTSSLLARLQNQK